MLMYVYIKEENMENKTERLVILLTPTEKKQLWNIPPFLPKQNYKNIGKINWPSWVLVWMKGMVFD